MGELGRLRRGGPPKGQQDGGGGNTSWAGETLDATPQCRVFANFFSFFLSTMRKVSNIIQNKSIPPNDHVLSKDGGCGIRLGTAEVVGSEKKGVEEGGKGEVCMSGGA